MSKNQTSRLIGAHCSIAGGVSQAPLMGAKIGCRAIQLFTGSNQQWHSKKIPQVEVDAFLKNMSGGGMRVAFSHACYLINLAASDPAIFKKSITAMKGELERADSIDLPFVVIHPGAPKERGVEWGIERVAEAVARIFDLIPDVRAKIAIETTAGQGSALGRSFEELAAIMDLCGAEERLYICLDTCHIFAAGYDIRTKEGYSKTLRDFDRIIGLDKLAAIHLNDSKGDLGSHVDRHEHIGKGKIGLEGFKHLMGDARLHKIPMVLETPKDDDAVKTDSRNLRTLLRCQARQS